MPRRERISACASKPLRFVSLRSPDKNMHDGKLESSCASKPLRFVSWRSPDVNVHDGKLEPKDRHQAMRA
eukprot:6172558-Pleurochrysis_carterae.AAC.1